jgi:hypothetical protein
MQDIKGKKKKRKKKKKKEKKKKKKNKYRRRFSLREFEVFCGALAAPLEWRRLLFVEEFLRSVKPGKLLNSVKRKEREKLQIRT